MKSEKRHRTVIAALRLTPAEYQDLTQAAMRRGWSLSRLLRESALAAVSPEGEK